MSEKDCPESESSLSNPRFPYMLYIPDGRNVADIDHQAPPLATSIRSSGPDGLSSGDEGDETPEVRGREVEPQAQ